MKRFKIILTFVMLCMFTSSSLKTVKEKDPIYIFGFSTSFSDPTVYHTEVQQINGEELDKNGFLKKREQYSYQLKNYLEGTKGKSSQTSMIYFSKKKAILEKEALQLLNKYKKDKTYTIETIPASEFKFVTPTE